MGNDIKREVDLAVAPRLAALGLRRDKRRYLRDFEGGYGWVTVAKTPYPHPRELVVDLYAGIWLEAIERLRHELDGTKEVPGETTVSRNVNFLARDAGSKPWRISYDASNEEIEVAAESIATTTKDYAIPFIESHSDLQALMTAMTKEYLLEFWQQRIRMTLGFHLLGDEERALELLGDTLAQFADTKGPAAEVLRSFARAYHERFS